MNEFIKYNKLFDCYGSLLTEKERLVFKDYYIDDLSLKEIADNRHISRSAVYKKIKNVEEKLDKYEKNLKLCTILETIESSKELINLKNKIIKIMESK